MRTTFNFYLGAAAAAWLLAVLVVAAELAKPFKELLKAVFLHHWIGKAVLMVLAFLLAGYFLRNRHSVGELSDERVGWYSVLGSLAIILLFYALEFFV